MQIKKYRIYQKYGIYQYNNKLKLKILHLYNVIYFLAHLSRRLKAQGELLPSVFVRRPSCVVRRPLTFCIFIFFLRTHGWILPNLAGTILRGRGFKVVQIVCVAPMGLRGRAPKGQNHANFKHLLLQIQKENSQVMCVDTLLGEE